MAKKIDSINERAILGAVLSDKSVRTKILGCVKSKMFVGQKHRAIFDAVASCVALGIEPDAMTVAVKSEGRDFGGVEFLKKLIGLGSLAGIDGCIDRLRKDHMLQKTGEGITELEELIEDPDAEYGEVVGAVSGMLQGLKAAPMILRDPAEGALEWKAQFERSRLGLQSLFVPTGIAALDGVLTEGFAPGNLTIIGGRPRMGKTILIVQMIANLLLNKAGPRIGVFPLEKGRLYFINLLAACLSGVPLLDIIKYPEQLKPKQVKRLNRWVDWMFATKRLEIIDEPFADLIAEHNWTNESATDRMGELMAKGNYGVGFWDVWGKALPDSAQGPFSAALKGFADHGVHTGTHNVLVHHVLRKVEDRSRDKARRPTINDLRDSGQLEQCADEIFLIHREKVMKKHVPRGDLQEIIVGKQKTGPEGDTILALFEPEICRVSDAWVAKLEDLRSAGAAFAQRGDLV